MMFLQRILELLGVILQAITPFEIPLDEIQTIFDTVEDIGLEWRTVNADRNVLEYVPTTTTTTTNPALVLVFHGFNGNPATLFTAGTPAFRGLLDFADTKGFIVMAPEATRIQTGIGINPRSWNDYGRGFTKPTNVDDVAFVAEVIDWAVTEHGVDRNRVFLAGVSGGGSMIYRLLHERSDLFQAAAPLISGLPKTDVPPPIAYTPTPIITVAGTKDNSFFFNGGHSPFYDARAFVDTIAYMAGLNGATSTDAILSGDLERMSTPFLRTDNCNVDAIVYTSAQGPLEAYVVQGGGHHVPGTELYLFYRPIHPFLFGPVRCNTEFDFMATMVSFFERFGL